jgi:ribosomal protein S12 methylthiotransferase accessory factor
MSTDTNSAAESGDVWPRLLGLATDRYQLLEIPYGDCPARFFMAIPKGGDGRRSVWLPPAARPGAGRAPSGGGLTREGALARCLGEAAELISSCWWGRERVCRATALQLGEAGILPNDLMLISERQYAERNRWNGTHGDYAWLPEPFDDSVQIDWVEAISPNRADKRLVPAAYALIGHSNAGEPGCFCVGDSNGCAAATSLDQAIACGFLELVERDATAIWWYGCHRRPQVDLRTVAGHEVLLDWLNGRQRRSHVLDITSDLNIPVFVAISYEPNGSAVALGFGADFDPDRAVFSALLEMCQMEISFEIFHQQTLESTHSGFAAWIEAADLASCVCCQPLSDQSVDLESYRTKRLDGSSSALERCLETCRAHDFSVFYVELTREEIAIPVARTIVPGLRHYKPRFAPGRLYEVPITVGWQANRMAEISLNPLPLIV